MAYSNKPNPEKSLSDAVVLFFKTMGVKMDKMKPVLDELPRYKYALGLAVTKMLKDAGKTDGEIFSVIGPNPVPPMRGGREP